MEKNQLDLLEQQLLEQKREAEKYEKQLKKIQENINQKKLLIEQEKNKVEQEKKNKINILSFDQDQLINEIKNKYNSKKQIENDVSQIKVLDTEKNLIQNIDLDRIYEDALNKKKEQREQEDINKFKKNIIINFNNKLKQENNDKETKIRLEQIKQDYANELYNKNSDDIEKTDKIKQDNITLHERLIILNKLYQDKINLLENYIKQTNILKQKLKENNIDIE
jgi:hypothetical protein